MSRASRLVPVTYIVTESGSLDTSYSGPSIMPATISSPQDRESRGSSSASTDSPPQSDGRNESAPPRPRKPIPRKGHTKSRRGCFNCKRRRIKCSERHPDCDHCIKAGLQCEYPANIIQSTQRALPCPHPHEAGNLRSTPGMFSMADMRLFHHFLITAYPHLPVGADKIWIAVIPSFAHNVGQSRPFHSTLCLGWAGAPSGKRWDDHFTDSEYEYLIHSILALAASHLDAVSTSGVAEQAIQHRILAVKSLNEALSVPPKSRCEQDARMAAALALTFQSSHLQDGMAEFLTMVRGCNLIAGDEASLDSDSAFHAFREDGHLETMRGRIGTARLNCINREDLDIAAMSLRDVEPLTMTDRERQYWEVLLRTVDNAYDRPVETYTSFVTLYNIPSRWSHDEFQAFIDPTNAVAQILLAHFIAVQAILTPILYLERVGFQGVDAPTAVLSWTEGIYRNIPPQLRHHVNWPRHVSRYPFTRFLGQKQQQPPQPPQPQPQQQQQPHHEVNYFEEHSASVLF